MKRTFKISFITPETDWSLNLVPELIKLRHEVLVNDCSEDCDVMFAIERTLSEFTMKLHRKYPKVPLIMNNWDWYEYTDKTKGTYPTFIQLLKESKEVWSGDIDTAKTTEKAIGIKSSFPLYIFIMPWEWEGDNKDYGYIIFGSRIDNKKKGGDIDLLIISKKISNKDKIKIKLNLFKNMDEQKIDIVIADDTTQPFVRIVLKESILL